LTQDCVAGPQRLFVRLLGADNGLGVLAGQLAQRLGASRREGAGRLLVLAGCLALGLGAGHGRLKGHLGLADCRFADALQPAHCGSLGGRRSLQCLGVRRRGRGDGLLVGLLVHPQGFGLGRLHDAVLLLGSCAQDHS